jgi:hypothetical protein
MKPAPLLFLTLALAACPGPGTGFDDHTVDRLNTLGDYQRLAAAAHGRAAGKFVITGFSTSNESIRYFDNAFYSLHDEWYWFRLMNDQRVPGREGIVPVSGHQFATVADIYTWAKAEQGPLPLDLTWVEDNRLYSPRFYDLALFQPPRAFGLGTLLHIDEAPGRPERWAFELEFVDNITHAELVRFFERLKATLPTDIGNQLFWVVRSPKQETFAQDVEHQQLPYFDRILRLKDLAAPGETEVYNEGLTAGRLKVIASGEPFNETSATDILILEDVPDLLPPAAGVVTAVPQTPLAHLNLLAKNRGIPNVYRGGVMDDLELRDLARFRAPVIIKATGTGELIIRPITEAQFATWQQLQKKTPVAVQQLDVSTLPYLYDLRTLAPSDIDILRPAFGGKAAGYLGLLAGAPHATPDTLAAITIRPYVEHLASFRARIEAMLAAPGFHDDVRVRALALEGSKRFSATHVSAADQLFLQEFLTNHPVGDVLGDFARADGLKAMLRAAPMNPATATLLTDALRLQFGHYAITQGLRFRSSSTAEDVEGFNGAGLYDSNTGFLDPAAQIDPMDQRQSVEWAVKKTWASYWSIEAFEERALENVDHLSGNMGVVVQPRFQDGSELSNGVFLFTLHGDDAVMNLNVQVGALSVTNPSSTQLPEVVEVAVRNGATTPVITRLRPSTVVPAGTQVLSDDLLLEMFAEGREVATKWLARENAKRPETQHANTQVLDFEFRRVPEGWPLLKVGVLPSRVVLKQTRSLEPGLRGTSAEVLAMPFPKDLLARSRKVERRTCESSAFKAVLAEALTDPLSSPDLGHSVDAFTASMTFTFKQPVPSLNVAAGEVIALTHLDFTATHPDAPQRWSLVADTKSPQKVSHFELSELRSSLDGFVGADLHCTVEVLRSTPTEFLLSLL